MRQTAGVLSNHRIGGVPEHPGRQHRKLNRASLVPHWRPHRACGQRAGTRPPSVRRVPGGRKGNTHLPRGRCGQRSIRHRAGRPFYRRLERHWNPLPVSSRWRPAATGEGAAPGDRPLRWSEDGQALYVAQMREPGATIDKLDLRTGQQTAVEGDRHSGPSGRSGWHDRRTAGTRRLFAHLSYFRRQRLRLQLHTHAFPTVSRGRVARIGGSRRRARGEPPLFVRRIHGDARNLW